MIRICCISDMHGNLPEIPDCDLLLIAGDIVPLNVQNSMPKSAAWLNSSFRKWLKGIKKRGIDIVGIAGNHDFIFERAHIFVPPDLPWTYLLDDVCNIRGLNIYGTPWQPYFGGWAFNLSESLLEAKWNKIPNNADIVVVHGPPHTYGDYVFYIRDGQGYEENVGSPSLLRKIQEVKPKLVVCGHIHGGYGIYQAGETTIINCSLVNERYKPVNGVVTWTI